MLKVVRQNVQGLAGTAGKIFLPFFAIKVTGEYRKYYAAIYSLR
jgi:hypothetical protein